MATNASKKAARELERSKTLAEKEQGRRLKEEQKELIRQAAEANKAAANAEVAAFECELATLTCAHKVQPPAFDWVAQHFSLPPHPPVFHAKNHLREAVETFLLTREYERMEERLGAAWGKDEQDYYENCRAYEERHQLWARLKYVAQQIQAGDSNALAEAYSELKAQGFIESNAGEIILQSYDARRCYVAMRISGREIVPAEIKTLTQSGKVSSKTMPKNRAREIYEDHACSRCIAVARILFATLPLAEVILTAHVTSISTITGNKADIPIVSVHFTKDRFVALNFDQLDPSDALQTFRHSGDVRASKRGEDFTQIRPLAFETPTLGHSTEDEVRSLTATIDSLRAAFRKFQVKDIRSSLGATLKENEQWKS